MPHMKCPRCSTIVEVAPGQSPRCPNCGYGSEGAPAAPPVTPFAAPPTGTTGFSSPPPMYDQAPMMRTSGKAIAALILGISALCVPYVGIITGILAIVFGALAIKEVNREPTRVKGKGMAIAGLICGSVALLGYIIFLIFFGALFSQIIECANDPDRPGCEDFQATDEPGPMPPQPALPALWSAPEAWRWPTVGSGASIV